MVAPPSSAAGHRHAAGKRTKRHAASISFATPARLDEASKPIPQVGKLVKRHIQEAVEFTQHLLRSFPQRLAPSGQRDRNPAFIARLPAAREKAFAFHPLQHRRQRSEIHRQRGSEIAHALGTALP